LIKALFFELQKSNQPLVEWAVVWLVAFAGGRVRKGRVAHADGREPRRQVRVVSLVLRPT